MSEIVNGPNRFRENRLNKGEVVKAHWHPFGHSSFVARGAALIELLHDDETVDESYYVDQDSERLMVYIPEMRKHRVTGLVDGTRVLCVFASRTPDGEVAGFDTGWPGASVGVAHG